MHKEKIAIIKCLSYDYNIIREKVEKGLELLGGIEKYVKKGDKVAIKPNLLMARHPNKAVTTHPSLIKAVADIVIEAGGKILIIDSPGGPYIKTNLKSVYKKCKIEDISDEKISLNYNLDTCSVKNREGICLKNIEVLKPLIEADLIINLPKLKSHAMMRYTGAVKNMYGAIPGSKKAEYHFRLADYNHFANAVVDIFQVVKPKLTIMDAIIGMDGNGPSSGNPKKLNFILLGENAFAIDLVALNAIDISPYTIPIIKAGIERGLSPKKIEEIKILGDDLKEILIKDFKIPQKEKLASITFFEQPILNKLTNIVRPKPIFDKERCIGCGLCAANCPPKVITMENSYPAVDLNGCIRCFCCQELCPKGAVTVKRYPRWIMAIFNNFFLILSLLLPKKNKDR